MFENFINKNIPANCLTLWLKPSTALKTLVWWRLRWIAFLIKTSAFVLRISKRWIYLSRKFKLVAPWPDSNLFLKFQNNFTAEFWVTFSYWLLLQRFSEIPLEYLLYQLKPLPENSVKNIRKIFYYTRFSFNIRVLLSAYFSRNIYHQWNQNIPYYFPMISVVLCKVSQT